MKAPILPVFVALLAVSGAVRADFSIGTTSCLVEFEATGGFGGVTADVSGSESDFLKAELSGPFPFSASNELGSVEGEVTGEMSACLAIEGGGAYLNIEGEQLTTLTIAGDGEFVGASSFSGAISSGSPGNETIAEFEVTGETILAKLIVSLQGVPDAQGVTFRLQEWDAGEWRPVEFIFSNGASKSINKLVSLEPGLYRTHGTISISGTHTEPLDGTLSYSLELGNEPTAPVRPPEGEYVYSDFYAGPDGEVVRGIGTWLEDPAQLQVVGPVIVSETDLGDGTSELVVTGNLVNTSLCPWVEVSVGIRDVVMVSDPLKWADVEAVSTVPGSGQLVVRVPNPDLPNVRAGILDGSRFWREGRELIVFRYPVTLLNGSYVESFDSVSGPPGQQFDTLKFSGNGIGEDAVGTVLIEWEEIYRAPEEIVEVFGQITGWSQQMDRYLPFLIDDRTTTDGDPTNAQDEGTTRLHGEQILMADIIKHGRLREVVASPLEGVTRATTEGAGLHVQALFPISHPVHFNRIKLGQVAELSGNFVLQPAKFLVETDISDFELKRLVITTEWSADLNLLIETFHGGEGDNTLADDEKTIFDAPLFVVAMPSGVTFSSNFAINVGALVSATRSLAVPLSSRLSIKMSAGVVDGEAFYDENSSFTPLEVSEPGIFEDAGASAEYWLQAQVGAAIGWQGVDGGPTFGVQTRANFGVHPLANPWWTQSADLELTAGMSFDIAELITLFDPEKVLRRERMYERTAGGPLLSPRKSLGNPGVRPLSGKTDRWSRVLRVGDEAPAVNGGSLVAQLPDGNLVVGQGSPINTTVSLLSPEGALLGTITEGLNAMRPIGILPETDGGFTLVGGSSELRLTRFDAGMNELSAERIVLPELTTFTPLAAEDGGGRRFVFGKASVMGSPQEVAAVVCLDAAGALLWAKAYSLPGNELNTVGDFAVDPEGDVIFCLVTSADMPVPAGEVPVDNIPNLTRNGLVAKVAGDSGVVTWATLIPHRITPRYHAMETDPEGTIYIGGRSARGFLDDEPTAMIVQLTPDGEPGDALMIGFAGSPAAVAPAENPGLLGELPHGGETAFDTIYDLVWADGGLWACGEMGIYNPGSVLSTGSSAITMRFNKEMAVSRYAIHGGRSGEQLTDIIETAEGPVAVGFTESFLPWPAGASGEGAMTPWAQWVMRIPWEGRMDFHPASNGARPADGEPVDRGCYYVYPRVQSAFLQKQLEFVTENQAEVTTTFYSYAPTLSETSVSAVKEVAPLTFFAATAQDYHAIEFAPESVADDLPGLLGWLQVDPDHDRDGDGRGAADELFFGTDPFVADELGLGIANDGATTSVAVPRSTLAGEEVPVLWRSDDLVNWIEVEDASVVVEPLDDDFDRVTLELMLDPRPDTQFFRVGR